MAIQVSHALLPNSCSKNISGNMNAQDPGKKRCGDMKITGGARSSSTVGKAISGYLRPIIARNATARIVTIGRSTGLAPETRDQNRSAGTGATKTTGAHPCVIGWGAEVTDMTGQKTDAVTDRGAGLIDMTGQKTGPTFTVGLKRWPTHG